MRRLAALLLVGAGILGASAALGATGRSSAAGAGSFGITSSLDGRTSLPFRIRWIATPTGDTPTGDSVSTVDFLIDGKLIWIEHAAPYVFGGDDNGANEGFLITTWLTPGSHQFTAQATTANGETASDTVNATVEQPPLPPAPLRGFWTRTVTKADLEKAGLAPPPAGRWKLIFDRVSPTSTRSKAMSFTSTHRSRWRRSTMDSAVSPSTATTTSAATTALTQAPSVATTGQCQPTNLFSRRSRRDAETGEPSGKASGQSNSAQGLACASAFRK